MPALVSPIEVKTIYESGLSLKDTHRELRRRGATFSYTTTVVAIKKLRAAGEINDAKREAAIAIKPLKKGGRPRKKARR